MKAGSKTKKNGVPPDQLFDQYGADTLHTSILFLGPADQDLEFDERGVDTRGKGGEINEEKTAEAVNGDRLSLKEERGRSGVR